MKKSHDNTIAAQLLGHIDPHSAGVTPSLQMSTTFVRDAENALVRPDNSYGRDQNDGVRLAEDVICGTGRGDGCIVVPFGHGGDCGHFSGPANGITGFGAIRHLLGNDEIHWRSCCAPWNGCRFY